jgi:ribosomal 50S subunit-recycling heat shock protein
MRVDKWLSSVNVVKRRTIATDMLKSGVVFVNGMKAKASKDLKIGDRVTIEYLKGAKHYEVLQIPTTKSIPKSKKDEYVKEL